MRMAFLRTCKIDVIAVYFVGYRIISYHTICRFQLTFLAVPHFSPNKRLSTYFEYFQTLSQSYGSYLLFLWRTFWNYFQKSWISFEWLEFCIRNTLLISTLYSLAFSIRLSSNIVRALNFVYISVEYAFEINFMTLIRISSQTKISSNQNRLAMIWTLPRVCLKEPKLCRRNQIKYK